MKRKTCWLLSAAMLLSVGGLVSCGPNHSSEANPSSSSLVPVASVRLSSPAASVEVGKTIQLTATVSPADASNLALEFSSSSPEVASVSSTGLVTGVSLGTALITVTTVDGGKTDSLEIRVGKEGYRYLGVNELSEELAATPYQAKVDGLDRYGLSSPDLVGVDPVAQEEKKYHAAKESYDQVIEVASLTLSDIQSVLPSATEAKNYEKIQAAILLAKKANEEGKSVYIELPAGTMPVDATDIATSCVFVLDGLKNVAIVGNSTVISLSIEGMKYKGYLSMNACENVILEGIEFDQEVGANVTGSILRYNLDSYQAVVSIDPSYNETMRRAIEGNKKLRSYLEFHKGTKAPIQGGNFFVDGFKNVSYEFVDGHYEATITFSSMISASPLGTLVSMQFAQYDAAGITISASKNIDLESLTMRKAYGMGLVASGTENLRVNRFFLMVKEGSKDLMTSCADAMHFSMLSGVVQVTNSIIEYSHDDALNIKHGYWYRLESASSRDKQMTLSKITSAMPLPKVGEKIAVYNQTTFEAHGTYTVASATEENGKMILTVEERISGFNTWGDCRVTFLSNTPSFEFSNNIVRNKRNRGVLVQVPSAVISNNSFINVGHGSIQAASAMDVFNEATLPQGLVIENNKFIGNNYLVGGTLYGDVSVFGISNNGTVGPAGTLRDVRLSNNFFTDNGNACVSFRGVGRSVVEDSLFYNASSSQPTGETFNCLFHLYNTADLEIRRSYNQYNLNAGLSGIIPQGSTSDENTILTDNKNIAFQVIDDVGPEVDIAKTSGSITVDGQLSEWDALGATDIEIRGYTDALGGEWSSAQLDPTFKINALKMTWNEQGIYVGFDVYDDAPEYKTINDFWLGDCVEILASCITNKPNADLSVYKEEGGVIQTAFAPNWIETNYSTIALVRSNSNYVKNASLLQTRFSTRSDGYSGEIFYPFELIPEFKTSIDEGKRIDIAIIIADSERSSRKRIQASNVPHNVENNKTMTARMPQYLFKD
ncbi:MAG: Ig-like domain-containing protein [Candidatus Enteromonas sp.]|nr:Ig-like domain-containing protein [Candidatus Enteromonas sp.]